MVAPVSFVGSLQSRAQYVSKQVWHPQQKARWLEDGSYELEVPFTDARELVNEVLWHGDQILIVSPSSLKAAYLKQVETMLKNSHTSASD